MPKKKKCNFKKCIKAYFKTTKPIMIALIGLSLILAWFAFHLMSVNKTYMFNGAGDFVKIYNGVISINSDVNVFQGSDIRYIHDEDFIVTDYIIGYYTLDKDDNPVEFIVRSGNEKDGISLRELIHEISAFNITEPFQTREWFSKESIRNLKNGMVFIIEAITEDGEEIKTGVQIVLHNVSK